MFYTEIRDKLSDITPKEYKRGDIIYEQGTNPEKIYLVDKGLVGLYHLSDGGKETFLRVFGSETIFGHRSYFAASAYHATSVALSTTTLVEIPKQRCEEICKTNLDMILAMTKYLATELGHAELRMAGLLDKSAGDRIKEALVYLKLKYPQQVWTRKEIADFSGSTFETVARVMSQLSDTNLIEKVGRDFKILDLEKILRP